MEAILERYRKEKIVLIIALVEERAHTLRLRERLGEIVLDRPVIDIAKDQLKDELRAYPGVEF
jgi:hypothetical protein